MILSKPHLILVRHSESEGNINSEIYRNNPDWKVDLTFNGRQQTFKLGSMLNSLIPNHAVSIIYSPYRRAELTAKIISKSFGNRATLTEDARLREQNWGNYSEHINPCTLQEKEEYSEFFYQIAGGESVAQVYDRAVQFMHNLVVTDKTIILVSHGIFLRTLTMYLNKIPASQFPQIKRLNNCDADIYDFININSDINLICGIRNLQIV